MACSHRRVCQLLLWRGRDINALLRTTEVKEKLAAQGADVAGSTPEAFATLMCGEIQKWAKLTAGLKLQIQ